MGGQARFAERKPTLPIFFIDLVRKAAVTDQRSNVRKLAFMLTCNLILGSAMAGQGMAWDWWESTKRDFKLTYHRNNVWPQPFSEAAAAQTRAPFEVMKQKGWLLHNTIGHELFRSGDGALTAAGRDRLRWIAIEAPVDRRVVHVLRGNSEAETEARVESVRTALAHIYIPGNAPQVFITDINPATSSGTMATQISRQRMENMVPPTLPSTTTSSAGQ